MRSIKLPTVVAVTALGGLGCSPVFAQITNGEQLLSACTANQSDPNHGTQSLSCMVYIAGATDATMAFQDALASTPAQRVVCLPKDGNWGALRDAVVKFIRERPDTSKVPSGTVMALALATSYPCKK